MLILDPRFHEIRHVPLSDWLLSEFPEHHLFVFFNHKSNVWEIGRWMGGSVVEEHPIGPSLESFDRDEANKLRYNLFKQREYMSRAAKELVSMDRADIRQRMDEQGEFREFMVWMANNKAKSGDQFFEAWKGAA